MALRTRAQTQWIRLAMFGAFVALAAVSFKIYQIVSFHEYPTEMDVYEEVLARIDQDGDGKISESEFKLFSGKQQSFRSLDTDGNDMLDAREVGQAVMNSEPGYKRLPSLSAPPSRGGPP